MEGFEAFHRLGDFLDEAVILLDDVVQVFHLQDFDQRPKAEEPKEDVNLDYSSGRGGYSLRL